MNHFPTMRSGERVLADSNVRRLGENQLLRPVNFRSDERATGGAIHATHEPIFHIQQDSCNGFLARGGPASWRASSTGAVHLRDYARYFGRLSTLRNCRYSGKERGDFYTNPF